MKKAFTLFASILLCIFTNATTKTVQSNLGTGWGTDTNWSPNGVPQSGDEVIIPAGQTITVKGGFYGTAANLNIYIHGTLDFDPSGKLNLSTSSFVQLSSSTSSIISNGTSSEQIVIGGGIKYNGANDGTITGPAFTTNSSPNSTAGNAKSGFTFGVLPIKLKSFTVQESNGKILLDWVTVLEEGLKEFELQRSPNGRDWKTIFTMQPKNNCACHTAYKYEDQTAEIGINYYRLRSVDWDGRFELSSVVQSKINALKNNEIIWNINKAAATLFVTLPPAAFEFPVHLQLLSSNGQVYFTRSLVSTTTSLDIRGLGNGICLLLLEDRKGNKVVTKMIK